MIFSRRIANWSAASREVRLSNLSPAKVARRRRASSAACLFLFMLGCLSVLVDQSSGGQVENVETPRAQFYWVNHARVEGHLALTYSPSGAFSPDSTRLAIANEGKVALLNLRAGEMASVLNPRVPGVEDLQIESANFLTAGQIFVLGSGEIRARSGKPARRTPELALRWDVSKDALAGKVHGVDAEGTFGPARWFPEISYLGLNRQNTFELWNPASGAGGRIVIAPLTHSARVFTFSPDGRWLLLAQIESSAKANPLVVQRVDDKFVNILEGHTGTVLSMMFSRDSSKVVTACEDGKVRIFSASGWNLLHTLAGHTGAVHWAEFSPDGQWVVSAGEDKTVRVWSAETGELVQTLEESQQPVLTVAFSPNGEYIAATSEKTVLVWKRTAGGL
jgi:WD40 repeat protein